MPHRIDKALFPQPEIGTFHTVRLSPRLRNKPSYRGIQHHLQLLTIRLGGYRSQYFRGTLNGRCGR